MKLYNSLTRKIEEIQSVDEGVIGVYTCGPTVYNTATIGNWRTYVLSDVLVRSLRYLGYQVHAVMNLTDVGHLTGDNHGDANQGEDRLEKEARKEGKTAWEISKFYADEFVQQMKKLNIVQPQELCKATDHIQEQIELVKQLEKQGLTYRIDDGIYFDIQEYESRGYKYGELSNLDQQEKGARLKPNPDKKDKRDFALWKFSPKDKQRHMEWDSPWGVGFPGWHIECSAMSMKYLGEQFAIHVGGEDLKSTHHPNEIAQSEGATGKRPFVKTWVHGAFLLVDGGKMGKSLGNAYVLQDIEKRGLDPLALRYFYLTGHYRKQLNFTWQVMEASQKALMRLYKVYQSAVREKTRTVLSEEKLAKLEGFQLKFRESLENDLNMPEALAVMWEVAKSNIPGYDKAELMVEFDEVMGLGLKDKSEQMIKENKQVSPEIEKLLRQRAKLRQEKKWVEADKIRDKLLAMGYQVIDK